VSVLGSVMGELVGRVFRESGERMPGPRRLRHE
jgi:hypothetical protein